MQKIIQILLLAILIPVSSIYAQEYYDTLPTLTVSFETETPFVYQDSEGHSVVVGLVKNNNAQTSVSNVMIKVHFFDDTTSNPIETVEHRVSLEVIPPNGISPYSIRSVTPNSEITQASVSLSGFDSAVSKQDKLNLSSTSITLDTDLHFSGTLQNAAAPISDTMIYLAMYDAFIPPRILKVETIDLGDVKSSDTINFEFNDKINSDAKGFYMFAESNIFYSEMLKVVIPEPQITTKMVTISDVSIKDNFGNKLYELEVGMPVSVKSETWIQFSADQESNETLYTYYMQIKEAGANPRVVFVGQHNGAFAGAGIDSQSIQWTPQSSGLYFIETFVWDKNFAPISEQGPIVLFNVK